MGRDGNPRGSYASEEADRRVFQADLQGGRINRLRVLHEASYATGTRHSDVVGTLYHAVERIGHVLCGDGRTVAVCHALSHLEGVCLAGGVHFSRHGDVWAMSTHVVVSYCRMPGYMWTMYDNSATDVLRCGSVCPRSKPASGTRMPPWSACCPVGVGSGRRSWATDAIATVGTAAGACVRVLLPERGGRCLLWRLGRSLWSRRTSARRYEQRYEGNSQ